MSVIATFNGANIIALPTKPGLRDLKITQNNTVGVNTNPFTKQQQVYDFMAGYWSADFTLPPMTLANARNWIAFFAELRGMTNTFLVGDPLMASPQGRPIGTPVVNGAGQSGYSLVTNGWQASTPDLLLPGDLIQIGYRMYVVTETVNSDSGGNATLSIWPQLRNSDAGFGSGSSIQTANCKTLLRLKEDPSYSVSQARLYGIQLSAVEAL
jgi:hypothetical protein